MFWRRKPPAYTQTPRVATPMATPVATVTRALLKLSQDSAVSSQVRVKAILDLAHFLGGVYGNCDDNQSEYYRLGVALR
jgi:hypothetical protein